MWCITKENYHDYLLGSVFFATGGGLPPQEHEKMFADLLGKNQHLFVKQCSEFAPSDILASVYGVGDPSRVTGRFDVLVENAIAEYERLTGMRIAGLIPGEIGSEALAFQAGACRGLAVVDSDLVGGRAAPEIEMDVFNVFSIPITPILAMDMNGSSFVISQPISSKEIEDRVRSFLRERSNNGVIVGYAITAGEYGQKGIPCTLSHTRDVGVFLGRGDISSAFQLCGAQTIAKEKLISADLRSGGGFLSGILRFENHLIRVKNENIVLEKEGRTVVSAPDLFCVMREDGVPLHNAEIKNHEGETLSIITVPAQGYWKEEHHRILWKSAITE